MCVCVCGWVGVGVCVVQCDVFRYVALSVEWLGFIDLLLTDQ